MQTPGFNIPCAVPLLPVNVDLLPNNGLAISQGGVTVLLDAQGVDGLLQVAGVLTLLRLGASAQATAEAPRIITP